MAPLAEESVLFIFAQVAVLFAGFGGVSMVLGRLQTPIERARLRNLILTALLLLLLSLFPLLPNQFGLQPETTWRVGTGLLALLMILFYALSGDLKLFRNASKVDQTMMLGDGLLIVLLIAGTSGLVAGFAANMYVTALFWHLFSACVMFVMVFAPVWQDADMGNDKS